MQTVLDIPFISVIMPVRNEARYIERSLSSVLVQNYPPDRMEVLVVDGMSNDATRGLVQKTALRFPAHTVRLLDNACRIVPTAMNIGISLAKGNYIARVDGHCELPSNYLERCLALSRETGAQNVGGTQYCVGEGLVAQAIALAGRARFGGATAPYRSSKRPGYVDTVFLGFWPKEALERLGGFGAELVRHQDYELNLRLRQSGGRIYFSPDLVVRYYNRASFASLARQYYQYGWWKAYVTIRNPGAFRLRHAVAPFFVAALVLAVVLAPWVRIADYALVALLSTYVLSSLGASIAIVWKGWWRYLLPLPIAFGLMHLSYGAGFWVGLVSSCPWSIRHHGRTLPHG